MISYSFYEIDNRVRRYAETLSARGDHVDIISLARRDDEPYGKINGVNIYRIQKRLFNEKRELSYLFRLLKFLFLSAYRVSRMHLREPYDVVHVHNIPDFEVFCAIIPKITGAKVILDIHDIVPEFYADKFKAGKGSLAYKLLLIIERMSMAFADQVIISNHIWQERVLGRSVRNGKCSVIMNYPDTAIFHPRAVNKDPGKFVLLYPGTLNRHQGVDIAIRAFSRIKDIIPEAEFHIIGEGPEKPALEKLANNLGLGERVTFYERIPLDRIAGEMAKSDVGIVPKRDNGFGGEAFSTKTWEFMALNVPVILARTKIDKFYFNEDVVRFFEPENEELLARAIIELRTNDKVREDQVRKAFDYIKDKNWELKKTEYLNLLDHLV
jgi:glycosyltransferase involved in cell wall biosynthesis